MNDNTFYLTSWSDQPTSGIYRYELADDGRPVRKSFAPLAKAGYLAWGPGRRTLYATTIQPGDVNAVAAFAVDAAGDLTPINLEPSDGRSICHLTASPDGKFLYAANYSSSTFAEFAISADGSIKRLGNITHQGHGPNAKRQECSHPHYTGFTPDGKFLAVVDLGIDSVKCYPFIPGSGIDAEHPVTNVISPAGSGPRHLAFSPDGNFAYLVNELGNTLMSFAYADGRLTLIQTLDLLPRGVATATKASAVRMTPDGRHLVATNRGFDTLVLVQLDGKGGMKKLQTAFSGGGSPRDVNFLPGMKTFAAGHEFTNNVRFFDFDAETGTLTPNGFEIVDLPRVLCVFPCAL